MPIMIFCLRMPRQKVLIYVTKILFPYFMTGNSESIHIKIYIQYSFSRYKAHGMAKEKFQSTIL